jgi:hypothetical protein
MKYKLDIKKDVDADGDGYMLWLPFGFRFSDDLVHVRCFDTLTEIRQAAKRDVVECDCEDCTKNIIELKAKEKAFLKSLLVD